MPKQREGLEQLLIEDLQDLFDAEKQLVRAIPKMAKAVSDKELAAALRDHLEVTKGQVQRLERIFESMDMRAKSKPCKGMKGIVEEGQEQEEEDREEGLMDSAIASAARKVEHYEMVGYESARSLAQQLGMREAAEMLDETLREEMQADKQLAQIGKRLLKGSGQGRGREGAASRKPAPARGSKGAASKASPSAGKRGSSAQPLTGREEIRQWAEERGATPSCVRGTGGGDDTGMIRLDFPGYSGEDSLEEISWDDWFEKFDENGLALLVQQTTSGGQKSNFNKLVKREGAGQPKTRVAR
jgi:ferritin-like metal-binding protein YciE